MLIDVHTHKSSQYKSIRSLHFPNEYETLPNQDLTISVGVHPWWAENEHVEKFETLFDQGVPQGIVAVGECGIDRVRGAEIYLQKSIFRRQIQIATAFNLPVIVHQVKGISDVLHEIKQFPNTVFVFHGYHGNEEQTIQLLKHNVVFSFGDHIITHPKKYRNIVGLIPMEKVLFETDDGVTDLRKIYHGYAQLSNTAFEDLERVVENNVSRIFNLGLHGMD